MDKEDFLEECLNDYDEQMEDTFDSARSSTELESRHHEVKAEILEKLPSKYRNSYGSSQVPPDLKKLLTQRLDSTFQKLKKSFEKSKKREETKIAALTSEKDALNFYNDEMDKYIQNSPNAAPKEINLVHEKFSTLALSRARKNAGGELTSQLMATIKRETEARRKFYYERAELVLRSNKDPAIGIDLGTTMCCVMVFFKGKCELVPNRSQGNSSTTPSYVAFHQNDSDTFGYVAKEEAYMHPETTIYDAKRMIGRPFTDPKIQNDMKKWPFEVTNDKGNVKIKAWGRLRYPHEVSARLLTRLRLMAEDHLGVTRGSIKKAVITVPAYFTEPQRRATNEAATCAGLHVLNILSEPTAAAIAYSWERRDTGSTRRALIYDLGGGTFDVAIAKVTSNNVEILCVDGDTHLGGQDFDQLLMDHCLQKFQQKEGIDLATLRDSLQTTARNEARSGLSRLKLQCEKAKERLTSGNTTTVQIDKIYGSKNLYVEITKSTMEHMVRPLVQKTIEIIEKALSEARSKGIESKADIDDVILVGGSTRMPLVMEMVQKFFDGKQLCKHINPDQAVAYGAAIQAAIMNKNDAVKDIQVQDVTPMSLGISIKGDKFSMLIPRNSKIPCENSGTYVTTEDNQTSVAVIIYQGESETASENKLLGKFTVEGFPPKPANEEAAVVEMTIDKMGLLQVKAVSKTTGNSNSITISSEQMGMDSVTMSRLREECRLIDTY